MQRYLLNVFLGALGVFALQGCTSLSAPTEVERNLLLQTSTSWDGTPYVRYPDTAPQLSLLKLRIPANTALSWHTHPIPNAAYILAGELIIESRDTGQTQRFKRGQAVAEMVNINHRGKTGDEPVELIVFYAGGQDIPLSE